MLCNLSYGISICQFSCVAQILKFSLEHIEIVWIVTGILLSKKGYCIKLSMNRNQFYRKVKYAFIESKKQNLIKFILIPKYEWNVQMPRL